MSSLVQDLRGAARALRRRPLFAAFTVATLALGIGVNTAVFSMVEAVLLRPLPYAEPERLVDVREVHQTGRPMDASWPAFEDWRGSGFFDRVAAYSTGEASVRAGSGPVRARVVFGSHGLLETLGVRPALGRTTAESEHAAGAPPVAVVSHAFWSGPLRRCELAKCGFEAEGERWAVVGVMPPGFDFPDGGEVWASLERQEPSTDRTAHNHDVVARLRDGDTPAGVEPRVTELTRRMASGVEGSAEYLPVGARVTGLQAARTADVRRPLQLLLAAAGFVLLVACANLASAFLARAQERQRELALRASLGAGRRRLVVQLTAEAALLAAAGGGAGLLLGAAVLRLLAASAPATLRLESVALSPPVLAFAAALAVLSALLFGLLPALGATGRRLQPALREARQTGGRSASRAWRFLLAGETALALLLVAGAGLLLRSLQELLAAPRGYETAGVVTAEVALPRGAYPDDEAVVAVNERLIAAASSLPGVAAAGMVSDLPLGSFDPNGEMRIDPASEARASASYRVATDGYFRAVGIPVLRGRAFVPSDRGEERHVAIVDRLAADAFWPGKEAIGQRLTGGGMDNYWDQDKWAEVVGVVGEVRHDDLGEAAAPAVYFPLGQRPYRARYGTLVARGPGDADALLPAFREAMQRAAPDVAFRFGTFEQTMLGSLGERRFTLRLLLIFALLALTLAAIGIYGVVAWAVTRRTREMGIRIALGAEPRQARDLLMWGALGPVLAGTVAAMVAATGLARPMAGFVYGIGIWDPVVWAAAAGSLLLVAATASALPARRVLRLDPTESLRDEGSVAA